MNRSVVAARAALANRPGARPSTPGTNPAMRVQTIVHARIPVTRTRACKMTGAQRNSEGRRSEWSMTPYIFTDPKWDRTVTS